MEVKQKKNMYCTKCGKQIEDGSRFCEYCGASLEVSPQYEQVPNTPQQDYWQPQPGVGLPQPGFGQPQESPGEGMGTTKLFLGIISCVCFVIISFQSCSTDVAKDDVAFGFLIAGIIGMSNRNSKGGSIAVGVFYLLTALIGFADLIWSVIALIFGAVFILGSINMDKKQTA